MASTPSLNAASRSVLREMRPRGPDMTNTLPADGPSRTHPQRARRAQLQSVANRAIVALKACLPGSERLLV